jgi:hypothetical protein
MTDRARTEGVEMANGAFQVRFGVDTMSCGTAQARSIREMTHRGSAFLAARRLPLEPNGISRYAGRGIVAARAYAYVETRAAALGFFSLCGGPGLLFEASSPLGACLPRDQSPRPYLHEPGAFAAPPQQIDIGATDGVPLAEFFDAICVPIVGHCRLFLTVDGAQDRRLMFQSLFVICRS